MKKKGRKVDDYERISDAAAATTLAGAFVAVAGFIAVFLTDSWTAPAAMAVGLLLVSSGLERAERDLE